jgi:biotin transport system substrate-specific component
MSLMKRILTAGDTVSTTRAADGGDRAGTIVPAPARTIGQTLLAVVAISVAAQLAVPIPATPVPVSLQDLVVMLIGVLLGPVAGTSAVITYLAIGAAGAPVFSNGHAGLLWLFGPTGGYLLAYPVAACVVGMAARAPHRRMVLLGGVLLAQAIIYAGGVSQLVVLTGQTVREVTMVAVLPFLPGAILKVAFVLAFAEAWLKWRAGTADRTA